MKTSLIFRRAVQALLPATLLLAACGKKDEPAPVVVDQGRVSFFHMAASANVNLKFLVDEAEKTSLNYGQNALNQAINTGSHTIKVNVASSGTTVDTKALTVDKDKNYSYFAYSVSGTTLAGLLTPDDLAAPSAGKAKIRLVHLGQGATTTLKLSTTAASSVDIPGTEVLFANASPFIEVLPGNYNVAITAGPTSTLVYNVGDGNGTSTASMGTAANKNYEAGKIYTVIYRGLTGATVDPALQSKAIVIQNN